jgi:hypothetical protein
MVDLLSGRQGHHQLSAALMLRDEPITESEARQIAGLVFDLLQLSRRMARILTILSKTIGRITEAFESGVSEEEIIDYRPRDCGDETVN